MHLIFREKFVNFKMARKLLVFDHLFSIYTLTGYTALKEEYSPGSLSYLRTSYVHSGGSSGTSGVRLPSGIEIPVMPRHTRVLDHEGQQEAHQEEGPHHDLAWGEKQRQRPEQETPWTQEGERTPTHKTENTQHKGRRARGAGAEDRCDLVN